MSRADQQAFPIAESETYVRTEGLTIREHFAAMAMQGLIADNDYDVKYIKAQLGILEHETYIPSRDWPRFVAKRAVDAADALLAELSKDRP